MKNKYEIKDGIVYIDIISKGKTYTCKVDVSDFDIANSIDGTWCLSSTGYAQYKKMVNGEYVLYWLHRMIAEVSDTDIQIDHRDGDRLNNTRKNLRITNIGGNSQNLSVRSDSKTGIRGVYYRKDRDKYVARITTYGKNYHIGNFNTLEMAEKHIVFARTILVPMADRENQYLPHAIEYDKPMLYFRHGAMSSGKSELLLISNSVYKKLNKKVLLLSSDVNTRDGVGMIKSRNGMSAKSIVISNDTNIIEVVKKYNSIDYVLVDEIHFFTKEHIEQLRYIVDYFGITVICYGLKVDFKSKLFETVDRLICLADVIQGIPHKCECGGNAIMNMRLSDGKPVFYGKTIEVGAEERYKAVCRKCYMETLNAYELNKSE